MKRKIHSTEANGDPDNNFKLYRTQTAFSNAAVTWKLQFKNNTVNCNEKIRDVVHKMMNTLTTYQRKMHAVKLSMALQIIFEKATDPMVFTEPPIVLEFEIYDDTDINK